MSSLLSPCAYHQDFRELRKQLALQVHLDERRSLLAAFHLLDWDATGIVPFDRFDRLVRAYVTRPHEWRAAASGATSAAAIEWTDVCGWCEWCVGVGEGSVRHIKNEQDFTLPRLMMKEMHEMAAAQGARVCGCAHAPSRAT